MQNNNSVILNPSEHDLLIRLDTNVAAIRSELTAFSASQNAQEGRIRLVENAITVLAPVPGALSHAELITKTVAAETLLTIYDKRINVLESALSKYVPEFPVKIEKITKDIEDLQANRSYILGGWKAMAIIIGGAAWLIGISIALANISMKIH